MMLRKLMLAALIAGIVGCIVGCGKRQTTVTTPEGDKATVETDRSGDKATVKVQTEEGEKGTIEVDKSGGGTKMTITSEKGEGKMEISESVDLSTLGVEIYPGAKAESGSTFDTGQGETRSASLTTSDSFDKVAEFYNGKYAKGASAVVTQPGSLMIAKEEKTRNVTITVTRNDEKSQTMIAITVIPKAK